MNIIDFHTHIWPDKVADKAKEYLENFYKRPMTAVPTIDNALKLMDENEISKSVIASVASRPDQVEHINNWLFAVKSERFIKFASLHPFYDKWSYELDRIKDNASGIKFQPDFQNFSIDDKKVFHIYEKIEKLQIPVLFHCGFEELFPKGEPVTGTKQMLTVKKYFPNLKFIAAHMGGHSMWDKSEEFIIGDDYFYIDTSSALEFMKKEQILRFFDKHNKNKILFASDFPVGNPKTDLKILRDLNLDENFLEKILSGNAEELICNL